MNAKLITMLFFVFAYPALAEPAGFEIQNKSKQAERITITNGVSSFTITLRSEENFVYRTTSSVSRPIKLESVIDGFPNEKNIFQWATFTIDMSGRYLSTFSNQASKMFPLDKLFNNANYSILSNEYEIKITSLQNNK